MSRIQDSLKRAEDHRNVRTQSAGLSAATPVAGQAIAISKNETVTSARLDDEVRRLETSLATWRVRPADPAAPQPPAPADSEWDEEIRRCQALLASCEERVTRAQQQRASLQAQVTEQEHVVAQAAEHLAMLQHRFQEAEAGVQQAAGERTAHGERLSVLRHCQALSQAAAEAEQRLQVNTEVVARIVRVQQRITEKLSQHQRASQELREASETLRRQLAETLAHAQLTHGRRTTEGGCHE